MLHAKTAVADGPKGHADSLKSLYTLVRRDAAGRLVEGEGFALGKQRLAGPDATEDQFLHIGTPWLNGRVRRSSCSMR